MKNSFIYLEHILEAIRKIEMYVEKIDAAVFYDSYLIQDAVVRELQVIGEAAKRVDVAIKEDNPQVFWSKIIGMRNMLIHDYFAVDLDILWLTIREDLPDLKRQIERIIKK